MDNNECNFTSKDPDPVVNANGTEKNAVEFLPTNHQLLQSFQQSLKGYLLRSKTQLLNEIADVKYQIKLQEEEREDIGAKLYEMQQEIGQQNEKLEEFGREIEDNLVRRRKEDEVVESLRNQYQGKIGLKKNQKAKYNKCLMELSNLQALENNIRNWADAMEDEVKNAKRIVSRDCQLQQQLSEEKNKSDLLFYHLDLEVKKCEKDLENITEELKDQCEVINVLNQSISFTTTDLETLQNEYKRLSQAWGEVIVAIQHRDKILHRVHEARDKEQELILLTKSIIEAIKKQISKELEQNEKLKSFKIRLVNDYCNLKKECQNESAILAQLEAKLEELPMWLEQTEKDLHVAQKEGNQLEIEIRRIQWKIDKQYNKKFQLEENILKLAQEQLITDKASEYRLKLLNNAQEQRRGLELNLAQSENLLAMTLLEIEKFKGLIFQLRQDDERKQEKLSLIDQKSQHLNTEMKTMETQINIKLKQIDKITRQLNILLKATEGSEVSPTERKINLLEKALHTAEQQIRDHQQFWLMLQNHYVNLSQKRNNQLNEIQITRKQLSIIKQKSLKIDSNLEMSEKINRDLNRDIQMYTKKVEMLNENFFCKIKQHESEESECEIEHHNLIHKLKDSEKIVLELEDEINNLRSGNDHYKDLVLDKHREALTWETKFKLIEETLRWRNGEKTLDSEVGHMKNEIHRMQIRYSQLKRAQENLVMDLEHCVLHREQIFIAALNKQRTETRTQRLKAFTTSRQKVVDLRNKLKQIQNEIGNLTDQESIAINDENQNLQLIIKKNCENIELIKKEEELLRIEIEKDSLQKISNLEEIVRKQNRAKVYRRLNSNLLPKLTRSEISLQLSGEKQDEFNENLVEAIQTLMIEIPACKNKFFKILHMLKN